MDNAKSGRFIAKKRAEKGLSQKELAEIISVTDKAVSKWETGRGFPDVSLLTPLAQALGVTVTELVNGEETPQNRENESADNAVIEALRYSKKMSRAVLGVILIIVGIGLAVSKMYIIGESWLTMGAALIIGAAVAAVGIFLLVVKSNPLRSVSRRAAGIAAFALSVCAVIAEIPEYAIVMKFGAPPGESPHIVLCSYFDLLPFGYGTLSPLITAVLSCAVALLGALRLFVKNNKLSDACFVLGVIATVFSVLHIPFFSGTLTAQSAVVTLLLISSVVMRAFSAREQPAKK